MNLKKDVSIGLEISQEYISAVELAPGDKEVVLKKYGKIENPPFLVNPSLSEENIKDPEEFKETIKTLFNNAGINGKHISVAVPDASVKISFVEFEDIPKDRGKTAELIKWNIKKTLPFPPDETVVNFQIIETPSEKNQSYKLVIAIIRKSVLAQYEKILNELSLIPDAIVPSSFAVYNLYHDLFLGVPECAVVMAYKKRIAVMALKHGKPHFHRSKETDDDKDGLREVLVSLNYYQNTCGTMPDRIYLVNNELTMNLKPEIETHFGATDIKQIGISDVISGANSSMSIFAGAAGAALKNTEQ